MISVEEVVLSHGPDDPSRFLAIADHFLAHDDREAAAAALDRAYGLAPETPGLAAHRAGILESLALEEHGLRWRYVPAGTFLMGSTTGEPDERPVHPRFVGAFWIAEVPMTFAAYRALHRKREYTRDEGFDLANRDKIRRRYCTPADVVPYVGVTRWEPLELVAQLSTAEIRYALPTEAQWEKAARGGLVGKRYAWGDEPPTRERADFDRMGDYRLADPRAYPANGYGLYAMCGGVAEWTDDRYDALAYARARDGDRSPPPAERLAFVTRGGSWADCADAITVSFRASVQLRDDERGTGIRVSPTIGFRLVRTTIRR